MNCISRICSNNGTSYCKTHQGYVCDVCSDIVHKECEVQPIRNPSATARKLKLSAEYLEDMKEYEVACYLDEQQYFADKLDDLFSEFNSINTITHPYKIYDIEIKADDLLNQIESSCCFNSYSKQVVKQK